jgi:hypothetical protein
VCSHPRSSSRPTASRSGRSQKTIDRGRLCSKLGAPGRRAPNTRRDTAKNSVTQRYRGVRSNRGKGPRSQRGQWCRSSRRRRVENRHGPIRR